jgi:hypothetical protein
MILAMKVPERVDGVFFFGCKMDPSGTKEVEFNAVLKRCFSWQQKIMLSYRKRQTNSEHLPM